MASEFRCTSKRSSNFEYYCRFSVDDGIIRVYDRGERPARLVVEVRTNFIVKGRGEEEDTTIRRAAVGSERFGSAVRIVWLESERGPGVDELELEHREIADELKISVGQRLNDYWMTEIEISEFSEKLVAFATGQRSVVVDLEVRTLQQEGETMEAAVARAMRPNYLAPLNQRPNVYDSRNPNPNPHEEEDEEDWKRNKLGFVLEDPSVGFWEGENDEEIFERADEQFDWWFSVGYEMLREGFWVCDVDKGVALMQECCVCGDKPFVGTIVSTLRCGHKFHYHCIMRRFIKTKDARFASISPAPPALLPLTTHQPLLGTS